MRVLPAALLAALALAAPAAAEMKTFGANLDQLPANNTRACAYGFLGEFELNYLNQAISMGYPNPYAGQEKPSCTWWTGGNFGGTVGAITPFGGGTVKKVRVKVGAVTGPMQVVVIRELREGNSTALNGCCFATTAASPVFTPSANGITELDVDMPVRHDLDTRTNVNTIDTLALSVLAKDVPVPAWVGGTGYDSGIIAGMFPAYVPGTERLQFYGSVTPGQVLLQAVMETTPAVVEPEDGGGQGGGDDDGPDGPITEQLPPLPTLQQAFLKKPWQFRAAMLNPLRGGGFLLGNLDVPSAPNRFRASADALLGLTTKVLLAKKAKVFDAAGRRVRANRITATLRDAEWLTFTGRVLPTSKWTGRDVDGTSPVAVIRATRIAVEP